MVHAGLMEGSPGKHQMTGGQCAEQGVRLLLPIKPRSKSLNRNTAGLNQNIHTILISILQNEG
jgi:hypothetical protein